MMDNKTDNDQMFKLKRNIKISTFTELLALAQLKDSVYKEIKSLEINLLNNKKYRTLITDLLDKIR